MTETLFLFCLMPAVVLGLSSTRFDHGIDIETTRPLIVAHRGFSGAYPEHTVEAYRAAVDEGADFIECDVCLTKDLKLVCLHEASLSHTTDVENRAEFADRRKTETVYNKTITDWFSMDFTLAEIKTLRKKQRYDFRDPKYDGQLLIATLDEHIDIAQSASRKVGIYPEVKDPQWVNSKSIVTDTGKRFEDMVLEKLTERGYKKSTDPCFVQCFDEESVRYMAPKTDLLLVMNLGFNADTSKIEEYAKVAYGLGVWKNLIVDHSNPQNGSKNWISQTTNLVERAHAVGLKVHAWTIRNEDRFLAWDYEQDPWNELRKFYELEVDGLFTDFTPTMKRFLDWQYDIAASSSYGKEKGAMFLFTIVVFIVVKIL